MIISKKEVFFFMYKYDSKTNRWRDKKGRFVSEKRVPLRYTFYYDSRVNRYRDTKTGKYISKEKVLKFVEDNNLGKINVLSKSGKLYRDNKIIDRLKKDVYDLAVISKYEYIKGIHMYTFVKDISNLGLVKISDDKRSWVYPDIDKLVDIMYIFYKTNHIKENDNISLRLYLTLQVWDSLLDQIRYLEVSFLEVTEREINKERIKKSLEISQRNFIESEDISIRIGGSDILNENEKILDIDTQIILKEWHKGGKK